MREDLAKAKSELVKRINFVLFKMNEIEVSSIQLDIHQMADLERFANTVKCLGETYHHLTEKGGE